MPYIANTPTINSNIFFTFENNSVGVVGTAMNEVVCSANTSLRALVQEYYNTDSMTARVKFLVFHSEVTQKQETWNFDYPSKKWFDANVTIWAEQLNSWHWNGIIWHQL